MITLKVEDTFSVFLYVEDILNICMVNYILS